MTDAAFWHMIDERRQQPTLSQQELEAALRTPRPRKTGGIMEHGADGKPWPDTTDGRLWAQMWIRRLQETYPAHSTEMSLASWFANAIMAAWEAAVTSQTRQDTEKLLDELARVTERKLSDGADATRFFRKESSGLDEDTHTDAQ